MKVRRLAEQLTELSRRGFGDVHVQIEVKKDGPAHKGSVQSIQTPNNRVVLSTEEDE